MIKINKRIGNVLFLLTFFPSCSAKLFWSNDIFAPTSFGLYISLWFSFLVNPLTFSPITFSTNKLDPVSEDSFTNELPSTIKPSYWKISWGFTRTKSPFLTSLFGISISLFFSIIVLYFYVRPFACCNFFEIWNELTESK